MGSLLDSSNSMAINLVSDVEQLNAFDRTKSIDQVLLCRMLLAASPHLRGKAFHFLLYMMP